MDPRVVTTLKLAAWAFVALLLFGYGSKHYKKHARKEALVSEMRTAISDASFYRSLEAKDAHATFLKTIAMMDEAKALGLEPSAYLDLVFRHDPDAKGASLSSDYEDYPARERIARETLLRGYQHAQQFSLLRKPENRELLTGGELPEGDPVAVVANIIDPAVSPGMEKIVPNLELRPKKALGTAPTDLEVAAAKTLAEDLRAANVIEYEAEKRITDHYLKNAAGKKEAAPAETTAEEP